MKHSSTLYVGLDVHKESIAVAYVSDAKDTEALYLGSIGTRQSDMKLIRRVHSKSAQLVFVYEPALAAIGSIAISPRSASSLGGGPLAHPEETRRQGQDQPARCRAARPPDALGGPHPVYVPEVEDEAIRDLSRAREDAIGDLKAAKYRLKAFLLRQDIRYEGKASWGPAHLRWLAEVVCQPPRSSSSSRSICGRSTNTTSEWSASRPMLQEKAKGVAGQGLRSIPTGLIPHRSPIPSGSAPDPPC